MWGSDEREREREREKRKYESEIWEVLEKERERGGFLVWWSFLACASRERERERERKWCFRIQNKQKIKRKWWCRDEILEWCSRNREKNFLTWKVKEFGFGLSFCHGRVSVKHRR